MSGPAVGGGGSGDLFGGNLFGGGSSNIQQNVPGYTIVPLPGRMQMLPGSPVGYDAQGNPLQAGSVVPGMAGAPYGRHHFMYGPDDPRGAQERAAYQAGNARAAALARYGQQYGNMPGGNVPAGNAAPDALPNAPAASDGGAKPWMNDARVRTKSQADAANYMYENQVGPKQWPAPGWYPGMGVGEAKARVAIMLSNQPTDSTLAPTVPIVQRPGETPQMAVARTRKEQAIDAALSKDTQKIAPQQQYTIDTNTQSLPPGQTAVTPVPTAENPLDVSTRNATINQPPAGTPGSQPSPEDIKKQATPGILENIGRMWNIITHPSAPPPDAAAPPPLPNAPPSVGPQGMLDPTAASYASFANLRGPATGSMRYEPLPDEEAA